MGEAAAVMRLFSILLATLLVLACGWGEAPPLGESDGGDVRSLPGIRDVTQAVAAPDVRRLLLLSGETLWVVHPEVPGLEPIELPAAVCGLAVYGHRAVVSHDGFVTLVDLPSRTLERILETHLPCGEVALSEHYAYLLTQELNRQLVTQISLSGGTPQTTEVGFFSMGCRPTLHPEGRKIYVACNDTVGRIGLDAAGRVEPRTSFEAHVDSEPGCNRMWVTDDGEWAYAACGGRLRSRSAQPRETFAQAGFPLRGLVDASDVDLSPSGRLPMKGIASMCDADGILAVIPSQFSPYQVHNGLGWESPHLLDAQAGRYLKLFSHPQLRPLASLPVPSFPSGHTARGRAVLCGLQDGRVHVLIRGGEDSSWGLWTVSLTELP